MDNKVVSLNEKFDYVLYVAWFMFFLFRTSFSSYISYNRWTVALGGITVAYLIFEGMKNGGVYLTPKYLPICSVLMGAFIAFACLSVHWSTEIILKSYKTTDVLKNNFILILLLELFFNNKDRIIKLLNIYSFAMFVFGIVVTFTTPISSWGNEFQYGGITGVHRNMASMIFGICIGIAIYLYIISKKIIYLFLIFGFVFFNLVTGSRKGIIQMALTIALIMLLQGDFKQKIRIAMVIILITGVGTVIFLNNDFLQNVYGARLLAIFDDSIADGSKEVRDLFRKWAFEAFLDRPLVGNGAGYAAVLIGDKYGAEVYSHCNYTELLCNYGIIGFCLYYSNYLVVMIKSYITGVINKKGNLAKMVIVVLVSVLVIEYGQITYWLTVGIMPLYVVFLTGMYVDNKRISE